MVEDKLSTEQPKDAEDTGLPVTNDQVELAVIHSFRLPLATCQNLSGQPALMRNGVAPGLHLRADILKLQALGVTSLGDTVSASSLPLSVRRQVRSVPLEVSICSWLKWQRSL